jgi:hypothetical protein
MRINPRSAKKPDGEGRASLPLWCAQPFYSLQGKNTCTFIKTLVVDDAVEFQTQHGLLAIKQYKSTTILMFDT